MGGPRYVWKKIQEGLRELEKEVRPELKVAEKIVLEQLRLVAKEYVTKGIEPRLDDDPPTAVPSGQSTAVQYRISPAPEAQEQTLVEDEHSSINEADGEGLVVDEDTVPLLIDFGLLDPLLQPPIEPNDPSAQLLSAAIDLPVTTDAGEGHEDQSITTAVKTRQADIPVNLSTMPSGLRNRVLVSGPPDPLLQPTIEPNNPSAQPLSSAIDLPATTDSGEGHWHGDPSITTAVETRQADIPANLSTMPSGLRNRVLVFGPPDPLLQPTIEPNNPSAQPLSSAIDLPVATDTEEGHGEQSITTALETRQAANLSTMSSGLRNRVLPAGLELSRQVTQVPTAHNANSLATPPELDENVLRLLVLVKVTGYRVLNTILIVGIGTWKGVVSYRGDAVISNTLDIILGVFLAIALYWLGLYETVEPPPLKWLFHVDYAVVLQRRWKAWRARWLTFTPPTLRRYSSGGEDGMELEYTPRSSPPSSPHDQC